MARAKSIKLLIFIDFPDGKIRIWDGSGPYIDRDGNRWRGAGEIPSDALDVLEFPFAGEAVTRDISLEGVPQIIYDHGFDEMTAKDLIGSKFQVLIQDCDGDDQPLDAPPSVIQTLQIVDFFFDEMRKDGSIFYRMTMKLANRFLLRRMNDQAVLSDVNQKARSAVLNPAGTPDQFCERVPLMRIQKIRWPRV
ncbi:hypothetical protein PsAD2_04620 [Pseudovibrio axinellae]|uniref:Uncharacterized protein n=1 Tax=Pseudovibrio axinellae TaxID=989403 RepID=A0A165SVR2_9HYPH|nr:hypothetical protein [Pseudovibrio axinellae]KZL04537.1 hypothetical protein PsAD2_04620 [Pseudovibrio axinellae]SEQ73932.1 hypothetical protein SAMN05421798_10488 [Pseudovibrio axinellae]